MLGRYRALVRARGHVLDAEQILAVERLQGVYDRASGASGWPAGLRRALPSLLTPQGLYLHGGVGVGKSMIMDLLNEHAEDGGQLRSRRLHYSEFMLDVHERMHALQTAARGDRPALVFKRPKVIAGFGGLVPKLIPAEDPLWQIGRQVARDAPLLCLDEFQVTDVADAMVLRRLFEGIWAHGGMLVTTSNRPPEELYEKGLNRDQFLPFIAELKRRCEVLELRSEGGGDYRARDAPLPRETRRAGHVPERPERTVVALRGGAGGVRAARDAVWRDFVRLSGEPRAVDVPVAQGRTLHVPHSGNGVAAMSFQALCGDGHNVSPPGASDYLALAEHFHTLFLLDMPEEALSLEAKARSRTGAGAAGGGGDEEGAGADAGAFRGDPNSARRFVLLLDALYERRCRLVLSTFAADLESLFSASSAADGVAGGSGLELSVVDEGGSSGRLTTMIGKMEWSATGIKGASLAEAAGGGLLETRFALHRAFSRLTEMQGEAYWQLRQVRGRDTRGGGAQGGGGGGGT